jgi:hypothetical protein
MIVPMDMLIRKIVLIDPTADRQQVFDNFIAILTATLTNGNQ